MTMMRVTICRPGELSTSERSRWSAYQSASLGLQHPFLTPDFARAYDHVSSRTRVAVAFDGNNIAGFFPFELARGGMALPLGGKLTNRQAFVHEPGLEWSWPELIAKSRLGVVVCPDLLREQARDTRTMSHTSSPVVDTSVGWEDYIKAKRARESIKVVLKKERRLHRRREHVEFSVGVAPAPWLHQVTVWKSRQYRRSGWPDPFADRRVRELLAHLNDDEYETVRPMFSALVVDGRLAAGDFSLGTSTVFATWFCAFDRDFAPYSPGAIRLLRTIQFACETGIVQLDLSRGDETYKQWFKNEDVELATGYAHRPSAAAVRYRLRSGLGTALSQFVLQRPKLRVQVRQALGKVGAARVALRP